MWIGPIFVSLFQWEKAVPQKPQEIIKRQWSHTRRKSYGREWGDQLHILLLQTLGGTYGQLGSITCTTCQCRCPSKVLKPWESKLPSANGLLSLLWLCSECAEAFLGLWVCAASPQFKYKRSSPWRRTCSWLLYIKTKTKQKKKSKFEFHIQKTKENTLTLY